MPGVDGVGDRRRDQAVANAHDRLDPVCLQVAILQRIVQPGFGCAPRDGDKILAGMMPGRPSVHALRSDLVPGHAEQALREHGLDPEFEQPLLNEELFVRHLRPGRNHGRRRNISNAESLTEVALGQGPGDGVVLVVVDEDRTGALRARE